MIRKLSRCILMAVLCAGSIPRVHAYDLVRTWPRGKTSVPYYVDTANITGLNTTAMIRDFQDAAGAWSTQASISIAYQYAGTTTRGGRLPDSVNTLYFEPEGPGSLLAETYRWLNSTGEIIDIDIVFYEDMKTITSDMPCSSAFPLLDTATHEFGHGLGLSHSTVRAATMYPTQNACSFTWRSLDIDDIQGIQKGYPGSTSVTGPSITTQPVAKTVLEGSVATFSITASGTAPLAYQWQKKLAAASSFSDISGATSASYTTPATTAADNASQFRCRVSNSAGPVTSGTALLTVTSPPTITSQPISRTVSAGTSAVFSVVASGSGLTYQWQRQNSGATGFTTISGATAASYTTPATLPTDNGAQFRCKVSNTAGTVYSNAAVLTVLSGLPTITSQPADVTLAVGAAATFNVVASGAGITYQWQVQNVGASSFSNISAATAASYTTPLAVATDSGKKFRCHLSNLSGSVDSTAATLTVNVTAVVKPTLTIQPQPQTVAPGNVASFSVTATGTAPLTYQWRSKRVGAASFSNIVGATGRSYTTPPTVLADNGTQYRCVVSNTYSTASNYATLTVEAEAASPGLTITSQPADMIVGIGQNASFSVAVTGSAPFSYKWKSKPVGASSFAVISGATSATYTVLNAQLIHDGTEYRCNVTDSLGMLVVTRNATLSVSDSSPSIGLVAPELISAMLTSEGAAGSLAPVVQAGQTRVTAVPGAAYSVMVQGSGFRSGDTLHWNDTPLSTNVMGATQLKAALPTGLIKEGTVSLSVVTTEGMESAPLIFAVGFAPSEVSAVRVYPNPWRADRNAMPRITFDQLPANTTVKIFTVAGHWVKTLETHSGSIPWDLTNDSGDKVASGLYTYLITSESGQKKTGQVVIVR